MYRFIYFTDSQADDRPLSFRNDNFGETILAKIGEVVTYANVQQADIICGGDFLDRPYITFPFLISLFKTITKLDKRFLIVLGNHDIVGRNLESYSRSALGVLEHSGIIEILKEPFLEEGFRIVPVPFTEAHAPSLYATDTRTVFVSHNSIVPNSVPFEHLLPDDISGAIQDRGSLVLSGHIHTPFKVKSRGILFYNPGSLGRVSREPGEAERTPMMLDIILQEGTYEIKEIPLKTAPDYKTTFKPREAKKEHATSIDLSDLKEMIHSTKSQAFNLSEYVKMVAEAKSVSGVVLAEALKRIEESETSFQLTPDA